MGTMHGWELVLEPNWAYRLCDDITLCQGIGFQILINDAAAVAESEYWKYVDDLTFAENNTGTI